MLLMQISCHGVQVFARAIFWRDETKVRSLGNGAEVSAFYLLCLLMHA
jgi:hypothetical protein